MGRIARICGLVFCILVIIAWTFSCFASVGYRQRFGSHGAWIRIRTGYLEVGWITGNEADRIALLDYHDTPRGVSIDWGIGSRGIWGDTWREHLRALGLTGLRTWSTPAYNSVGLETIYLPFWMPLLAIGGPTFWLWLRRRGTSGSGACEACGYDLTGNLSGQCPECGTLVAGFVRPPGGK
ncbi:MAG: hypothetical protein AMXMBFR47_41580 [Planctomycetota bacterium]